MKNNGGQIPDTSICTNITERTLPASIARYDNTIIRSKIEIVYKSTDLWSTSDGDIFFFLF
jgi:hypothetical protein